MRKLIAGFAASIDGFIEGPKGEIDWITHDKDHFKEMAESWKKIDAMFHGRRTYETVKRMQEGKKKQANPFAHMKHYVFSRTLKEIEEGYILVNDDIENRVEQIKNEPGKNIAVFGGAELLSSLLNAGLVDELEIAICPVLIGGGRPFFTNIKHRIDFTLRDVKSYASGLVILTYTLKKKNKP